LLHTSNICLQHNGPEQQLSKLNALLKRQEWRGLQRMMGLLKFMAHCNPALASQLAQAGGVSTVLGEGKQRNFPGSILWYKPQCHLIGAGG